MTANNNLGAVSTCPIGEERYKYFDLTPRPRRRGRYIQYEWRSPTNELFSCVAPTLEQCREKREVWIKGRVVANISTNK
ncbi:MAG: DUF3873 family protein [Rikenellaceae bacterium]